MSIDRGDGGEWLHAFNRDRFRNIEDRLRELDREQMAQSYLLETRALEARAQTVRIRRLEARPTPMTTEEIAKQLWQMLWFRATLIVLLLQSNLSLERVTKFAALFARLGSL